MLSVTRTASNFIYMHVRNPALIFVITIINGAAAVSSASTLPMILSAKAVCSPGCLDLWQLGQRSTHHLDSLCHSACYLFPCRKVGSLLTFLADLQLKPWYLSIFLRTCLALVFEKMVHDHKSDCRVMLIRLKLHGKKYPK